MKKLLVASCIVLNLAAVSKADDAGSAKKEPWFSGGVVAGLGDINGNEVKPLGVELKLGADLGSGKFGQVGVNLSYIQSTFDNTEPFKTGGWKRTKDWNQWTRYSEWPTSNGFQTQQDQASLRQIDTKSTVFGGPYYRTPRLGRLALEVGSRVARINHDPRPNHTGLTEIYETCNSGPQCVRDLLRGSSYRKIYSRAYESESTLESWKGFRPEIYTAINALVVRPGKDRYGDSYPGVNLAIELTKSFWPKQLAGSNYGARFNVSLTGN
ncbi:MAG: hypothetical protein HY401_07430 [Elusimicrobia bacterium]|nr:hypothetical protein [Elusimicrobiota bacterium]